MGTGKPYEVNEVNVHVWYILRIGCTPHEQPLDLEQCWPAWEQCWPAWEQCWPGSSVGLGAVLVLAWEQY